MGINGTTKKRSSVVKRVTTLSDPILTTNQSLSIGQMCATLRAVRGISQKELSRLSELHISVIRKLELDEGSTTMTQLQKAVRALHGVVIVSLPPYGYMPPKEEKDLGMVFNLDTHKKEPTIFPPPFVPVDNNYAKDGK